MEKIFNSYSTCLLAKIRTRSLTRPMSEFDEVNENVDNILLQKPLIRTNGPFSGELSNALEAEVHVFTDSVRCMGKQAMSEPAIKMHQKMD